MPLLTTPSGRFGYFNSSSEVPFNPASLAAPLMTWFKGDAGLTTNSWTNYGTNGGSATMYGITITTQNGLNAVDFTDANSYGEFTWIWTGDYRVIFFVCQTKSIPSQTFIIGEPYESYNIAWYTNYNEIGITNYDQGLQISTNPYFSLPSGMAVYGLAYAGYSGGANNYASLNGVYSSVYVNTPLGFNDVTNYTTAWFNSLGGSISLGTGMILCEVLCYDGIVTPTDATKVTDYLKSKWGISSPPPYTVTETSFYFTNPGSESAGPQTSFTESGGSLTYTWSLYESTDEYGTIYNYIAGGSSSVSGPTIILYEGSTIPLYWYYYSVTLTNIGGGNATYNTTPLQNAAF